MSKIRMLVCGMESGGKKMAQGCFKYGEAGSVRGGHEAGSSGGRKVRQAAKIYAKYDYSSEDIMRQRIFAECGGGSTGSNEYNGESVAKTRGRAYELKFLYEEKQQGGDEA